MNQIGLTLKTGAWIKIGRLLHIERGKIDRSSALSIGLHGNQMVRCGGTLFGISAIAVILDLEGRRKAKGSLSLKGGAFDVVAPAIRLVMAARLRRS